MKPAEPRPAGDSGTARGRPAPITSAATARSYVRSVVAEHWRAPSGPASERAVMDLLLVVSELVTNAIRHGGGLAGFELALLPEGVKLSVHDYSDAVPSAAYGPGTLPRTHEGSGYGWPLIIRLSREILIERRREGGKTVGVLVPLT
ncbi:MULTISPECIES: ATP-binding protein [unclassified Streptomyces]|uniref:ATP-binding protein n=1 Tax=unclassified Streptomyces TaxID=2593676 RepID=UPI002366A966|nr:MULTISPECIES: ATP-binding protein [unclassified Streptomyces]MDF3147782.1 ATP-binding protein [Streptomyces sp. T21Q-yed]WDF35379.1 ATP-binding protein [Streptomyces sp. T12]